MTVDNKEQVEALLYVLLRPPVLQPAAHRDRNWTSKTGQATTLSTEISPTKGSNTVPVFLWNLSSPLLILKLLTDSAC